MRGRAWEPLMRIDDDENGLASVLALEDPELHAEDREEILGQLTKYVADIGAFWRARRQRGAPVRAAKVGRNDPCPCGSGKKWKKCCGAGPSTRLH